MYTKEMIPIDKPVTISTHNYPIDVDLYDIIDMLKQMKDAYEERIEHLEDTIREYEERLDEYRRKYGSIGDYAHYE
jgi:chaperonin cofactor prefoldin